MKNFETLGLIAPILRAIQEQGYDTPTPVQEQAVPLALERRDLLGCAQTGTGKTAAFALPILQLLAKEERIKGKRKTRALILTPTRELALQIEENFKEYGRYLPLTTLCIFGGVSQFNQTNRLAGGVDILIATPGRLMDLMEQGFVKLSDVNFFVLDEADRMLDMGFINDVRKIVHKIPTTRQTMLFSATMPKEIEQLAQSLLNNPSRVEVTPPATTVDLIQQSVYLTDKVQKRNLLVWLLNTRKITNALVFTRTKHGADRVAKELNRAGISARAIHGDKSQSARQLALSGFRNGDCRVLVATDIAARGIDIEELSHVINYELPNVPETYVHRIGRTGRAGLCGTAISFCDCTEADYLLDIEFTIGKDISRSTDHPYPLTITEMPPPPPRQPRSRKSNQGPFGPIDEPAKKSYSGKKSGSSFGKKSGSSFGKKPAYKGDKGKVRRGSSGSSFKKD